MKFDSLLDLADIYLKRSVMAITLWDLIKHFYKEKFNINPDVIEYISVNEILKKCVTGYSNDRIANSVNEPVEYVKDVIKDFFGFSGWEIDLDANPFAIYNRSRGDFNRYKEEISMVSSIFNDYIIKLSYNICKKYDYIKKIIKDYNNE